MIKKLFMVLLVCLCLIQPAVAATLFTGVAITGASNPFTLSTVSTDHTVALYYTDANASISAITVALQAAADPLSTTNANAHWVTVASHAFTAAEITAKTAMFHVINAPTKRVRLNITTLTGAGAGDLVYGEYIPGR